jgi:hypothetical protein
MITTIKGRITTSIMLLEDELGNIYRIRYYCRNYFDDTDWHYFQLYFLEDGTIICLRCMP